MFADEAGGSSEDFGNLFRGAAAFPPGRGVWRDDPRSELVFDDTVLVTSQAG